MNTNTTPSYPPAIVARVTAEFEQLSIRLQKLEAFLDGPNVASLEAADVRLLQEQRVAMMLYFDVLARRLTRMTPGTGTMKLAEPPLSSASVFSTAAPNSAQGGVVTPPEGTLFGFASYAGPNLSGTQHVLVSGPTLVRSGEGGVFGGAGAGGDFGGGSGSSDSSSSSSSSSGSSD